MINRRFTDRQQDADGSTLLTNFTWNPGKSGLLNFCFSDETSEKNKILENVRTVLLMFLSRFCLKFCCWSTHQKVVLIPSWFYLYKN